MTLFMKVSSCYALDCVNVSVKTLKKNKSEAKQKDNMPNDNVPKDNLPKDEVPKDDYYKGHHKDNYSVPKNEAKHQGDDQVQHETKTKTLAARHNPQTAAHKPQTPKYNAAQLIEKPQRLKLDKAETKDKMVAWEYTKTNAKPSNTIKIHAIVNPENPAKMRTKIAAPKETATMPNLEEIAELEETTQPTSRINELQETTKLDKTAKLT